MRKFVFPAELGATITAVGHPEGIRTKFELSPEGWACEDGCSWWSEANIRRWLTGFETVD